MLKRFLIFVFLVVINSSCKYFEDCDGPVYQIKVKKELGGGICEYRADSITDCLVWNDQVTITFTDTCDVYLMSQTIKREELYKKYGK